MAMNIQSAATNMATKSAMVGFVPKNNMQEVKKEEEHSTTIQELDKQDTENNAGKAGKEGKGANDAAQTRNQNAAQQARRRQISQPQVKQESTATESSEGKEAAPAGTDGTQAATNQPRGALLDNTARINWQFQQNQANATANAADNPAQSPDAQKKQFLTRLKGMVNLEYQQYVKSDTALYSRRNLREIMSALGENHDPNVDKLNNQDSRGQQNQVPGEPEGYNKFNQMRASKSLQVLHQYQQEPPQDQLSLVA